MINALSAMGVDIRNTGETDLIVSGSGQLRCPPGPLTVGNAGTAMRFLTAAAVLVDGTVVIDGDQHMRQRPIGALVQALRSLGAMVDDSVGTPPVRIQGTGAILGGRVEVDAAVSSQFLSALLMLAPCGRAPIEIALRESAIGARGYIDLTSATMAHFGAHLERVAETIWRAKPTGYTAANFEVEPDASACTYLWAAGALTGGQVRVGRSHLEFSQPDARAYAYITDFPQLPAVIDGSQIQDAVPTLAVMAAFNRRPVRFTGIANLRVKECDRIRALATELSRISPGLGREETDDLIVDPGRMSIGPQRTIRIETYNDHRIAMSLALAGLRIPGIEITNARCVAKTYPRFWQDLAHIGARFHGSGC